MNAFTRLTFGALLAALVSSSCAPYPPYGAYRENHYTGSSYDDSYPSEPYPPQQPRPAYNVAPLVATGVAVAALAAYANERQSRHRWEAAAAWGHRRHGYPAPYCHD